jgi:hypothetical protein
MVPDPARVLVPGPLRLHSGSRPGASQGTIMTRDDRIRVWILFPSHRAVAAHVTPRLSGSTMMTLSLGGV